LEKKYFNTLQQDCEPPVKGVTIRVAFFAFAILCLGLLSAPIIFLVKLVHFWFRKHAPTVLKPNDIQRVVVKKLQKSNTTIILLINNILDS
jgi:hypothetical protein